MIHDELHDYMDNFYYAEMVNQRIANALFAVVELHKPEHIKFPNCASCAECQECGLAWPCPTFLAIEKELG